jgi:hypothetical protein
MKPICIDVMSRHHLDVSYMISGFVGSELNQNLLTFPRLLLINILLKKSKLHEVCEVINFTVN